MTRKNVTILFIIVLLLIPTGVLAESLVENISKQVVGFNVTLGLPSGAEEGSVMGLVIAVINVLLTLLGLYFVVIIMYAGYTWMTAQGDKDKVTKARDTIRNGVIGVIIILLSYVIANYVVQFAIDIAKGNISDPGYRL